MLSFRKKILISDLVLFLVFIALLFPFVSKTVSDIVRKSLEERASELIAEIDSSKNESEMVETLRERQLFIFFRVSLADSKGHILYESHVQQLLKDGYYPDFTTLHPEVQEALKYGVGHSQGYSKLFEQKFAYVAKSFVFQGKTYVIRTAFPFREVEKLTKSFKIGFLSLGVVMLLLYGLMTWLVIHRLSNPIQEIINAIKPYQEGNRENLPKIELKESLHSEDDFNKLAQTLNSLSHRIQKQIETVIYQHNENESILDSLVEGIIAFNANQVATYANPVACKMLGVSKEAFLNQEIGDVKSKAPFFSLLIEKCKTMLYSCQQKGQVLRESLLFGESKTHLDIIAVPRLFKSGAILVLQDKSSDYRMLEMGKDFIANASHELRTPITIIRGFAETLQDLPDLSPSMLKEITEKIVRTCDRLNNLVKNILLLADIENTSSSRFYECDLGAIAENCKHALISVHKDTDVPIDQKKEPIVIAADADLIELAIMNLCENAVKYSTSTPKVAICLDQIGDEVMVTIEDNGIGIPSQDIGHIFERFYTVDKARSRRHGGAGLGLSIVKTIIEKHGGQITVNSQVGIGTKFTILLPALKT